MLTCERIISTHDKQRLVQTLEAARKSWLTYSPHLDFFLSEVRRTDPVSPEEIPADIVTMNSQAECTDPHTGQTAVCTLVYPVDESPALGRVSILSPFGMALFGARSGEEIVWHTSNGPQTAIVNQILYQPEAAGHHTL